MPNEFRSQSQMGGRVDYVKAGKPIFNLAKEARIQRAKMGGNAPGSQPPAKNKAPMKQGKKEFDPGKMGTAPHGKDIKPAIDKLEE